MAVFYRKTIWEIVMFHGYVQLPEAIVKMFSLYCGVIVVILIIFIS
jgi:hypothetical protein